MDEGLQQIEDLGRRIIAAHDEKATLHGAPAAEVEQHRPRVVAVAKAVTDRLRREYLSRQGHA